MHTLDLRHDPAAHEYPEIDRIIDLAREIRLDHPDLADPLVLHWSDVPVLALDRGRPWCYGPVERDPLARAGRTVVPSTPRRILASSAARGAPAQAIAVAHELDPRGPVAGLLPVLAHGPRTCTDDVARSVAGTVPPHPVLARAVRLLDGARRRGGRALASAVDGVFDPIVFSVVTAGQGPPRHGELALWYPLAAWRW